MKTERKEDFLWEISENVLTVCRLTDDWRAGESWRDGWVDGRTGKWLDEWKEREWSSS